MISAGPSSAPYSPRNDGTLSGILRALYNDPFKWQVVKKFRDLNTIRKTSHLQRSRMNFEDVSTELMDTV
ncbi:unnamed protein product [Ixodes pacificus]